MIKYIEIDILLDLLEMICEILDLLKKIRLN